MSTLHRILPIVFFAFSLHFFTPFATAQYLLDALQPTGKMDKTFQSLSTAIYRFTANLDRIIFESNVEENIFFSPTSIYIALAMLYPGSGGKTKTQMASVLHLDVFENDNQLYESIKAFLLIMNRSKKNYTLNMANRLFSQSGFKIKNDYLNKTGEYFNAELESMNFAKDASGSRSKINKWVSEMTSDKIPELLSEGDITSDTLLVLANAVYFNSSWLYKFNKNATQNQTFFLSKDKKIQVPMMHLKQMKGLRYSVSKNQSLKLLELPYNDEGVSMIILLDEGKGDFDKLLRGKTDKDSWRKTFEVSIFEPVGVSFPKFTCKRTMDLKKSLQDLGLTNLFGSANLSGITESTPPLVLSKAIHKAYISVDEEGTVASAATGLNHLLRSAPSPKDDKNFIVDRPFVFFVVERNTRCILFFGQIQNPLQSD